MEALDRRCNCATTWLRIHQRPILGDVERAERVAHAMRALQVRAH